MFYIIILFNPSQNYRHVRRRIISRFQRALQYFFRRVQFFFGRGEQRCDNVVFIDVISRFLSYYDARARVDNVVLFVSPGAERQTCQPLSFAIHTDNIAAFIAGYVA